jgi:hypothetical protein
MDFVKKSIFKHKMTPEFELRGQQLRDFITAGNATFTILNEASGNYYTYNIKKHDEHDLWFVKTLVGGNTYEFIGTYRPNAKYPTRIYTHGRNSTVDEKEVSVTTFKWVYSRFLNNQDKYPTVKVFHTGKCGRCNKKLTTPESIKSGIGPVCGGKVRSY